MNLVRIIGDQVYQVIKTRARKLIIHVSVGYERTKYHSMIGWLGIK